MEIIRSQKLSLFSDLIHGSSTKDYSEKNFTRDLGIKPRDLITCETVHSCKIKILTSKKFPSLIPKTDGLITPLPNLFLSLFTADCVPVFLYDPQKKIVGLVHAGWLGTLKGITRRMVQILQKEFGSQTQDLVAYLGPAIAVCCYDNKKHPERITLYRKQFGYPVLKNNHLDLKLANVLQLRKCSLRNIEVSPYCTFCNQNLFPSHRREGSKRKQSIIHVIGRKS